MENLTRKQQAFAESMSANPDQTQTDAARAAGYAESGAKVTGCRLAQDPRVIAEIRRLRGGVVGGAPLASTSCATPAPTEQ